jgi:hypothetical protein
MATLSPTTTLISDSDNGGGEMSDVARALLLDDDNKTGDSEAQLNSGTLASLLISYPSNQFSTHSLGFIIFVKYRLCDDIIIIVRGATVV